MVCVRKYKKSKHKKITKLGINCNRFNKIHPYASEDKRVKNQRDIYGETLSDTFFGNYYKNLNRKEKDFINNFLRQHPEYADRPEDENELREWAQLAEDEFY